MWGEGEAGRARQSRKGILLLARSDPTGALREVRRRIVRVEERAARTEFESGIQARRLRIRGRAVEDLDGRPQGRHARHRVPRHCKCIERAARPIGGADDIERVAVGRESERAVGFGHARRVGAYDREGRRIRKRDRLRRIRDEKYRESERRPARPNGTACVLARSDGDAAAAHGRTGCRVCWNFQGSPPRTPQPTCVRAGRPSPYSAGLVPAGRRVNPLATSGSIEEVAVLNRRRGDVVGRRCRTNGDDGRGRRVCCVRCTAERDG